MQRLRATQLHLVLDPLHAIYCMQFCFMQVLKGRRGGRAGGWAGGRAGGRAAGGREGGGGRLAETDTDGHGQTETGRQTKTESERATERTSERNRHTEIQAETQRREDR